MVYVSRVLVNRLTSGGKGHKGSNCKLEIRCWPSASCESDLSGRHFAARIRVLHPFWIFICDFQVPFHHKIHLRIPQPPAESLTEVSTQSSSTVATEEDHSIKGGRLMGSAVKSLLKCLGTNKGHEMWVGGKPFLGRPSKLPTNLFEHFWVIPVPDNSID